MKKTLFTLMLFCCVSLMAKEVKRPDTYNYNRGLEAFQNANYAEALDYFQKELRENPKNGYAYFFVSSILADSKEYGAALNNANLAVKKIPSKDKIYKGGAYQVRSMIRLGLADTTTALKDLSSAISYSPTSNIYSFRAQLFFSMGRYEESQKDYEKMIAINEGDCTGHLGIARILSEEKKYAEASAYFDHAIKLCPNNIRAYLLRAEFNYYQKEYSKALEDVVTLLEVNDKIEIARKMLILISDSAYAETLDRLKIQQTKYPNDYRWEYYEGITLGRNHLYDKAIECLKSSLNKEKKEDVAMELAYAYNKIEDYAHSIEAIDVAISIDSSKCLHKAELLSNRGAYKECINLIDEVLPMFSKEAKAFMLRAYAKEKLGDNEGALADYSASLSLDQSLSGLIRRGRLYRKLNEKEKSDADFRKCIELDKGKTFNLYAYYYLGENAMAIKSLNESLKNNSSTTTYYNAACIYSMMGDTQKSVEYLKMAFDKGYDNLSHIRYDEDLENVRNSVEYKQLIESVEKRNEAFRKNLMPEAPVKKETKSAKSTGKRKK